MNVWLVTPAWQRFNISRLVLAQRARLRDALPAGVTVNCVVIADDENLDIAREFGFDTIELPNDGLGRKVNAGFAYALECGADLVAFIGSDDWLHPDLFECLGAGLVSGRRFMVVDTTRGVMREIRDRSRQGVPPWFIPAAAMKPDPITPHKNRGMEYAISIGLKLRPPDLFADPHAFARVALKTETQISPYSQVTGALGFGLEREAWSELRQWFPEDLVAQAEALV